MQILVVSKDDSLTEYLRAQGRRAKAVYTNDIVLRAAREFGAETVIYCTNALKLEGHDKVIQELQNAGFRVILAAEKGDPVVQFAAALGVTDLLTFPVDPADVLYRLDNPATREEAADVVRRLAEGKRAEPEEKREKMFSFKFPFGKKGKSAPEAERAAAGKETGKPAPEQAPEVRRTASERRPEPAVAMEPDRYPSTIVMETPGPEQVPEPDRSPKREDAPGPARAPELENPPEAEPPPGPETEGADLPAETPPPVESPAPAGEGPQPASPPEGATLWKRSPEETAPPAPGGDMQAPPAAEIKIVLPKGDEAYRDALTDCFTRRFLLERLTLSGPYSVVFIDLDNFKPVNDILGHEAGDRVLAAFGKMLNEHLKGRDLAVRWGGDEFVLVLPDTSPKGAEKVIENLRRAWEKAAPDTGNLKVGFSAGISSGKGADGLPEAIRAADKAMYARKGQAKRARQNAAQADFAGPIPQVIIQAVPVADASSRKGGWWEETKRALTAVAVILEAFVILSAGIWLTHQALLIYGKSPLWLAKVNDAVVWFWSSLWTGIFG